MCNFRGFLNTIKKILVVHNFFFTCKIEALVTINVLVLIKKVLMSEKPGWPLFNGLS